MATQGQLVLVLATIGHTYRDSPELASAATSAVHEVAQGDVSEEELVAAWQAAKRAERIAKARLDGGLAMAVAGGESRRAIAARLGRNRVTVTEATRQPRKE